MKEKRRFLPLLALLLLLTSCAGDGATPTDLPVDSDEAISSQPADSENPSQPADSETSYQPADSETPAPALPEYDPVCVVEELDTSEAVWAQSKLGEAQTKRVRDMVNRYFAFRELALSGSEIDPASDGEISEAILREQVDGWPETVELWQKAGVSPAGYQITYAVYSLSSSEDSARVQVNEFVSPGEDGAGGTLLTEHFLTVSLLPDGSVLLTEATCREPLLLSDPQATETGDGAALLTAAGLDPETAARVSSLLLRYFSLCESALNGETAAGDPEIDDGLERAALDWAEWRREEMGVFRSAELEYELCYAGLRDKGTHVELVLYAEVYENFVMEAGNTRGGEYQHVLRAVWKPDGTLTLTEDQFDPYAVATDPLIFLDEGEKARLQTLLDRYAAALSSALLGESLAADAEISPDLLKLTEQWGAYQRQNWAKDGFSPAVCEVKYELWNLRVNGDTPMYVTFTLTGTQNGVTTWRTLTLNCQPYISFSPAGDFLLEDDPAF